MDFNNFCTSDGSMTSLSISWHRRAATASAACVARLEAVAVYDAVDMGQHACVLVFVGLRLVDILNIPCDCQFVSLYLTNFMFHITLDAVGNILRVHYKSMKCSASTLFRWGEHVFHVCEKIVRPAYSSAKIINIKRVFPELWSQMYCHLFYELQCTCGADWSMTRSVVWKQYWLVMDRRPDRQTTRAIAHTAQHSVAR